jgi:hypothetical protein
MLESDRIETFTQRFIQLTESIYVFDEARASALQPYLGQSSLLDLFLSKIRHVPRLKEDYLKALKAQRNVVPGTQHPSLSQMVTDCFLDSDDHYHTVTNPTGNHTESILLNNINSNLQKS